MNEIYKQLEELEREQKNLLHQIQLLKQSFVNENKSDLLECYQLIHESKYSIINLFDTFYIRYEIVRGYKVINYLDDVDCWHIYEIDAEDLFNFQLMRDFITLTINHSTKEIIIVEVD